jgi:cell division protein FtsQ
VKKVGWTRFVFSRILWCWGITLLGVVAGIWIGYVMLLKTEAFQLTQIKISGAVHIRPQEIRTIFEPVLRHDLLTMDLDPFIREVLDRPWVREVRIRKVLPDTLLIDVQERTPAVAVESRRESHWVDAEGVVLSSVSSSRDTRFHLLPHITGISLSGLIRRDPDQLNRLHAGLTVIELIKSQPASVLASLGLEDSFLLDLSHGEKDPRLYLHGYPLRFGEGAYKEKWKSFLVIYEDLKVRGLAPEEIDLRFTDQVVVKTF